MTPLTGKLRTVARRMMYQDVCESLQQLIEDEKLWGSYLAPERELARALGVSRKTLRRGIEVLEKKGVVARRSGRGTLVLAEPPARSAKGGKRVAICMSGSVSPGELGLILAGMGTGLSEKGWIPAFRELDSPENRRLLFRDLADGRLNGIMLIAPTDRELVEELLGAWSGPLLLTEHWYEDLPMTGVIDDGEGGARLAMDHLLSLGHRRIGFVDISRPDLNPWRHQGYIGALEDAGIGIDTRLIVSPPLSLEGGCNAAERLLDLDDPPTAILAFDQLRAWGVWRAAERRDLKIGKDLALVAFGDSQAPAELSTVRVDGLEIGRIAIRKLGELMDGEAERGACVKVPGELVVSQSSGGPLAK